MIQQRSIAVCIILTIVTCGIYGVYWFICLTNDANTASNTFGTSGGYGGTFNDCHLRDLWSLLGV